MAYEVPPEQPGADDEDAPVLRIDNGVPVSGAGRRQQWEGIVMTQGGRGLCTAAFISDRHLISASRGVPDRAAIRVTDNGRGNLIGMAGSTRPLVRTQARRRPGRRAVLVTVERSRTRRFETRTREIETHRKRDNGTQHA